MKINVLQNTALVGDNQSSASTFFLSDPIPIIALPCHSVGALVKSKRSVSYALSAMGWDVDINFHNADVNIIFHYADIIKHYADHFSHFQSPLAFRADFGPLSLSGQLPGQFLHWIFPMQYWKQSHKELFVKHFQSFEPKSCFEL